MAVSILELSTSVKTAAPHIENVLEQLYEDTSLEDQYKSEISALFQELLILVREFNTLFEESNDLKATLVKTLEISEKSLQTAQKLTEIEFLDKRDSLIKSAISLSIHAAIDTIFLAKNRTLKIQNIFYHKKFFGGLEIAQYPITLTFITEHGLTINFERYIRALLILNDDIITKKDQLEKTFKQGFGKPRRKSGTLREIRKLSSKVVDLLNLALTVNQKKEEDSIVHLTGISWISYENLSQTMAYESWCRISYANETLELLVPTRKHEKIYRKLDLLISKYCDEYEIPFCPLGSTRFKKENSGKEQENVGKEPDSSYTIGVDCTADAERSVPDLAIEVNWTSGSIQDLEDKYQPLGVSEVWIWDKKHGLRFYALEQNGYIEIARSQQLDRITPQLMQKYLDLMDVKNNAVVKKEFIHATKNSDH